MSQIAIIKDVFRNTPHVLVYRDADKTVTKSLTEFGSEIAKNLVITSDIDDIGIPDGFSCTGFRKMTPAMKQLFASTGISEIQTKSLEAKVEEKQVAHVSSRFSGRSYGEQTQLIEPITGVSLRIFNRTEAKIKAIDYKARRFQLRSKVATVISPIKSGIFGFDAKTSAFTSTTNPLSAHAAEKAEVKIGNGSMRRFMSSEISDLNYATTRRAARRSKSLLPKAAVKAGRSINDRFSLSVKSRLYRG